MNQQKGTKINQILQKWPKGTVATAKWLVENGIRSDLLDGYKKSGWVQSMGKGAVTRTGDRTLWHGAVYALQQQLSLSVHPGGPTALSLHGTSHNLGLGDSEIILFAQGQERLPHWFITHQWKERLHIVKTNLFPENCKAGLVQAELGDYSITLSSRERAILETLYLTPEKITFANSSQLMEGLVSLHPAVLQRLMEQCNSIKVKRLALVLAELHQHSWLEKLDLSKIDLGKGKRSLVKGAKLHPVYHITVPDFLVK